MQRNLKNISPAIFDSKGVNLIVTEDAITTEETVAMAVESLIGAGYLQCADYRDVLQALNDGREKIFYIETGDRLNSSVLEIAAEFDAGIVGLADKIGHSGLMAANWDPTRISLVLVMTRGQVEASYSRLFEYVNYTVSL